MCLKQTIYKACVNMVYTRFNFFFLFCGKEQKDLSLLQMKQQVKRG